MRSGSGPLGAPRLGLLTAAVALLALALFVAPGRRPDDGRQSTLWLAVESRALPEADATAAFASQFGAPPQGVDARRDGQPVIARPQRLWTAGAAAVRRLAGWHGLFALQAAFVVAIGLLMIRATRPRLGSASAERWTLIAVGATALPLAALALSPELLGALGMAIAAAALWGRRTGADVEPGQVYGGELDERVGLWRWPVAGAGMGLALLAGPSLLPLAAPLFAAAPRGRRLSRGLALLAGAALLLAAAALLTGTFWAPLEFWYDLRLLGWSGLALLIGRHVGVLTLFLPLLAAFDTPDRDAGRRWIPWAVAAGLVLQLITSPFDVAGPSGGAGNAWFLPAAVLLIAMPARLAGPAPVVAALGSLLLLAPLTLERIGLAERPVLREADRVRAWLPVETTEREIAGRVVLDRGSGIVLSAPLAAAFGAADGTLRLTAARVPLIIESGAELSSLRLEFGAAAPAAIDVAGGTAGDLLARPSGELALDVDLAAPDRRHPTWRSPRGASIYFVTLGLDGGSGEAPVAPVPLDLSLARPIGGGVP